MNDFDNIPFEQNDSFSDEKNNVSNEPVEILTIEEPKVETLMDENNIIVLDERVKNIPKEEK